MAAPPPLLRHIIALDTKISHFLHSLFHSYLPTSLLLLLELSADFRFSFPITLALSLSPLSFLSLLSPLLFGLLLDLALVGLIKIIFRRHRPPYNPSMSPAVSADNFSFPSGHASRVFLVAALISLSSDAIERALSELKASNSGGVVDRWIVSEDEKVVGVVVVVVQVWAAVTAVSRVLLGRHFLLDVLAGACLGVLEGVIAFRFLRFEEFLR